MPLVGFEPTISRGERPQTYALDRAATGTGTFIHVEQNYHPIKSPDCPVVLILQGHINLCGAVAIAGVL